MNARRLMRLPKSEDDSLSHQAALLCITANSDARLLLWVRVGHSTVSAQCPNCPPKRKSIRALAMSQKCHVWTAPAMQEESDVSARRSGAAMYSAFECSRYGRRP